MEITQASRHWTTTYEVIPAIPQTLSTQSCAKCSVCNKCQAGEEAIFQGGKIFCWKCYTRSYAFTCVSCSKIISGDSKVSFINYNNQVWHQDCFRCSVCRRFLQDGQLVQEGKRLYCWRCSEKEIFLLG